MNGLLIVLKRMRVKGFSRAVTGTAQQVFEGGGGGVAKKECVKENFGGAGGGMLVDFYSISLK